MDVCVCVVVMVVVRIRPISDQSPTNLRIPTHPVFVKAQQRRHLLLVDGQAPLNGGLVVIRPPRQLPPGRRAVVRVALGAILCRVLR